MLKVLSFKSLVANGRRGLVTATQTAPKLKDPEWDTAKPYDTIPSPSGLKQMREFFKGGQLYDLPMEKLHQQLQSMFGDIILIKGILRRKDVILLYDPVDFEKLFRHEGAWPIRNGLDTLTYFRKNKRPDIYNVSGGLLTEHGEKWAKFRSAVNPIMMQPKVVKQYIPVIDEIAIEFTEKIRKDRNRNNEVGDHFLQDVGAWALESISFIALDTRLNVISSTDMSSDGHKIVECARQFFLQSYKLEALPSLWKYFSTPLFRQQMKTLNELTNLTMKHVNIAVDKLKEIENNPSERTTEESVLQKLLKIDKSIAFVMASDMLLAGADTTGSQTTGIIYLLAKNRDKQQILREEVLRILPSKDSRLKSHELDNAPYLRAVLKEAGRLQCVLQGTMRETVKDMVIKGYRIPKGTDITPINVYLYHKEEYFPQSNKFLPERWLKHDPSVESIKLNNPFVYLPFGFGPRACIGKRFADLEMQCLVARLVRNYEISWNQEADLKHKSDFVNAPQPPVRFGFKDLEY